MFTAGLYLSAIVLLSTSFLKDKKKTGMALKKAWKSFEKIMPQFLSIILVIGIMLAILSPQDISRLIGKESGWIGIIIAAITGSITLIPGFVASSVGWKLMVTRFLVDIPGIALIAYAIEKMTTCQEKELIYEKGLSL